MVKFEICILTTALHDDSEITNISDFLQVVFLQDFVNFETFLRAKKV